MMNSDWTCNGGWNLCAPSKGKAKIIQSGEPCISVYSDASLSPFGARHNEETGWQRSFDIKPRQHTRRVAGPPISESERNQVQN